MEPQKETDAHDTHTTRHNYGKERKSKTEAYKASNPGSNREYLSTKEERGAQERERERKRGGGGCTR